LVCCTLAHPAEALPAFPGAEGFGAKARPHGTSSGRARARVIRVTTLKPSGPGSLQAACAARGPRIVVFAVSGVIRGNVTIRHSNLTIAGQTAPGAGITIEGRLHSEWQAVPNLEDVVIRFLRVRPRRVRTGGENHDCLQLTNIDRLILDHVSCSWGCDENVDLSGSRSVTVQWCSIEESDTVGHPKGQHNFGMILAGKGHNASIHHNLFAHHMRRAPLCGVEVLDCRNNVVYNVRRGVMWPSPRANLYRFGEGFRANVVGNYFKGGPDAPKTGDDLKFAAIDAGKTEELYAAGNVFAWLGGAGVVDPWKHPLKRGVFSQYPLRKGKPWPAPAVQTHAAAKAYELVLAHAGCLPRDCVGRRTIREVREGKGSWGRHEPAKGLMDGLTPRKAALDSDGDGMPDVWERAHGLNPDDAADAGKLVPAGASASDRHKGYTYVEFYINELADKLIADALRRASAKPQTTRGKGKPQPPGGP